MESLCLTAEETGFGRFVFNSVQTKVETKDNKRTLWHRYSVTDTKTGVVYDCGPNWNIWFEIRPLIDYLDFRHPGAVLKLQVEQR